MKKQPAIIRLGAAVLSVIILRGSKKQILAKNVRLAMERELATELQFGLLKIVDVIDEMKVGFE